MRGLLLRFARLRLPRLPRRVAGSRAAARRPPPSTRRPPQQRAPRPGALPQSRRSQRPGPGWPRTAMTRSRASASRSARGSSARSRAGLSTTAAAMATNVASPAERVLRFRSSRAVTPTSSAASRTWSLAAAGARPRSSRARPISSRTRLVANAARGILQDHTNLPGRFAGRHGGAVSPAHPDCTADAAAIHMGQEPGDAPEYGRLPGPRGTGNHSHTGLRDEFRDRDPGVTNAEVRVADGERRTGARTAVGRVPAGGTETAEFQRGGNPAGVFQGALQDGHQGARPKPFAAEPEGQADGGNGVGQCRQGGPRHHQRPGHALQRPAPGQPDEAAGDVHQRIEHAEAQDGGGDGERRHRGSPQTRAADRPEHCHVRKRRGQPYRREVKQERFAQARAVEEDTVDDPRRDEHGGKNRRCSQRRGPETHAAGVAGSPSTEYSSSRLSPGLTCRVARPSCAYSQAPPLGLTQMAQ